MKFWVGDPCYHGIFNDYALWDDMLSQADYFENVPIKFQDRHIDGHSTEYGDGVYFDRQQREYPVDAGLIGIVEWKEGDEQPSGMHLIEFDAIPKVAYFDGEILITDGKMSISIETGAEEPAEDFDENIDNEYLDDYDPAEIFNEE